METIVGIIGDQNKEAQTLSLKMADDERIFCVKMTTSGNNVERLCFLVRKMSESETISKKALDITSICFSDRKI